MLCHVLIAACNRSGLDRFVTCCKENEFMYQYQPSISIIKDEKFFFVVISSILKHSSYQDCCPPTAQGKEFL